MLAVWVERKKSDFERERKILEEKLQGIRQTR
jgi:hypothetical protein